MKDYTFKPEELYTESWSSEPDGYIQIGTKKGILVRHTPTGITIKEERERSQHQNMNVALDKLEEALQAKYEEEVMSTYDRERMEEALKTSVTQVPSGLTKEETRQLILARACDVEASAKYGNAVFDYYQKNGMFPTSRDQLGEEL